MHVTAEQMVIMRQRAEEQVLPGCPTDASEQAQSVLILLDLIGEPPMGSEPDEILPRDATWHKERLNWIVEVDRLRGAVRELDLRLERLEAAERGEEEQGG